MLCWECGAQMTLVQVVEDTTKFVSGYEHHTWQCSGCAVLEERMIFTREKTPVPAARSEPAPTVPEPTQAVQVELTQAAPLPSVQSVPVKPTQSLPAEPTQAAPSSGPAHPNPPVDRLQTNARLEKLRKFQAAKEAASETERRRAEFKRFWDSLLSVPSP